MINIIVLDITVTSKRYPCSPVGDDGKQKLPSPHSGYGCQIGCGENGSTGKKDQIYNTQTGEFDPIRNFYIDMGLDPLKANNTNTKGSDSTMENPIMQ
ncbi:hypothetical protein [Sulfurovum sp. TSL1]|uniref:hypothetical protein n=1 Tax=Sulfurovum sp. TSL1 TaxID=2826994 RepID=UPI001CC4D33D|nr:hypothetical protein [Sulfurovum sp. TSL1]GIT98149.1 hypothetical protein TSL1_09700 [Sulfurovum sp. TSL1]